MMCSAGRLSSSRTAPSRSQWSGFSRHFQARSYTGGWSAKDALSATQMETTSTAFNCWHNPALFHTGWFVESLFTQTLIIHVIRTNKIPFLQSWASGPLILTSLIIVLIGAYLPFSPVADSLGFVPLPLGFWPLLGLMLLAYVGLTQIVKTWFIR